MKNSSCIQLQLNIEKLIFIEENNCLYIENSCR